MLEDRDYMREPDYGQSRFGAGFRLQWSGVTVLLAVNVLVFLLECIFYGYPLNISAKHTIASDYFALSAEGLKHGYLWQFLTFQFMHAGFLHIFMNSWTIFVFGRILESHLGTVRFLALYFASGIIGGVVEIVGGLLWHGHFGTAVMGASAGGMGLLMAFATLYPTQQLTMFLLFIPVPTRALYFVLGFAVLSVLCILFPGSSFTKVLGENVANGAHLGGMFMGWLYIKFILKNPALIGVAEEDRFYRTEPAKPVKKAPDEFEEGDVDAVLDKISARGINSLTARERSILEAARKKIAQH